MQVMITTEDKKIYGFYRICEYTERKLLIYVKNVKQTNFVLALSDSA